MANKRQLKRNINYVCGELFAECAALSVFNGKAQQEEIESIISSIIITHNDYICRISHPEPGMTQKTYFKTLREDFSKQVTEIIDLICAQS